MILTVIGRPGRERSAVASHLGAHLNAVVVDGALELSWERESASRGPDIHDVLAGRASPIEAVCQDGPVAIVPCGRAIDTTPEAELITVLHAVEREYGHVLIDCPRTTSSVSSVSQGVVLVAGSDAGEREETLDAAVVAIALLGADRPTALERLERRFRAPVTPIPGVPRSTVSMASDQLVAEPIQRALRRLADSVHASMRS